jgi:hypothetical protein
LDIVADLLTKSTKGQTFHGTIFHNKTLDEARSILAQARNELQDSAIVSLVSSFEHIVFRHPASPLQSRMSRKQKAGWRDALPHFKSRIAPRVYDDVERLCEHRNWLAHGKRWEYTPTPADPISAYQRVSDFLEQAGLQQK